MRDYTPTTEDVRDCWEEFHEGKRFDSWLVERDAALLAARVVNDPATIVVHGGQDAEEYAAAFNDGFDSAMAQVLADDPTAADEWLEKHDTEVSAQALIDSRHLVIGTPGFDALTDRAAEYREGK